ncbi:MAG TPA: hypothetical protein VF079_08905 [Sphingomicrobium sp.]
MSDSPPRRRIPYGELIAFAALIVSAFGVWIAWKASTSGQPTRVVEQRQPIPLTLRGKREDDGTRLEISPVEAGHALQSLTITLPGGGVINVGSDGELRARDVEAALKGRDQEPKNRALPLRVQIDVRYVEMGHDRRTSGSYALRYMWKSGGLFSGRSLHLVALGR